MPATFLVSIQAKSIQANSAIAGSRVYCGNTQLNSFRSSQFSIRLMKIELY